MTPRQLIAEAKRRHLIVGPRLAAMHSDTKLDESQAEALGQLMLELNALDDARRDNTSIRIAVASIIIALISLGVALFF